MINHDGVAFALDSAIQNVIGYANVLAAKPGQRIQRFLAYADAMSSILCWWRHNSEEIEIFDSNSDS